VAIGDAESDVSPSTGLAFFSGDAMNWVQTGASDGSFESALMQELHAVPGGYIAVGYTLELDAGGDAIQVGRAWLSADGQSWRTIGQVGGNFSQYGASEVGSAGLVFFTADQSNFTEEGDVTSVIQAWFVPSSSLTP
jgi:hypothetical protein